MADITSSQLNNANAVLLAMRQARKATGSHQNWSNATSLRRLAIGANIDSENTKKPIGLKIEPVADVRPNPELTPRTITIYPSLASGAIKDGSAAIFRIWSILIDQYGQLGGWCNRSDVYKLLTKGGSFAMFKSRQRVTQILQDGDGTYWTFDHNQDRVWLCGAGRVAFGLGVESLQGKRVKLPVRDVVQSLKKFKSLLYASFHSGRDNRPISRARVATVTGVSIRSQQRYEAISNVSATRHFALVAPLSAENLQDWSYKTNGAAFAFTDWRGLQGRKMARHVAVRLPSSYTTDLQNAPQGRKKKINRKLRDFVAKWGEGTAAVKVNRIFHTNGAGLTKAIGKGAADGYFDSRVARKNNYRFLNYRNI